MSIFAALDVYHDTASRSAALNMAIDEALLEHASSPSIRFYRWDHPALSFGYFGKFNDVAEHRHQRDLVRRWTGGGVVFHGDDLTYSIVIPASEPVFTESATSIYAAVHNALRDVLVANGEQAELAAVAALYERRNETKPAVTDRHYNHCFANAVRADVLVNGRKVAGAAQRRTRHGLLQQGSIQLATERVRPTGGHVDLGDGLAECFANELCQRRYERSFENSLIDRAQEIARERYGTADWLRRC